MLIIVFCIQPSVSEDISVQTIDMTTVDSIRISTKFSRLKYFSSLGISFLGFLNGLVIAWMVMKRSKSIVLTDVNSDGKVRSHTITIANTNLLSTKYSCLTCLRFAMQCTRNEENHLSFGVIACRFSFIDQ